MAAKKLRHDWDCFQIVADPIRRKILDLIRDKGPIRTMDLAEKFSDLTRPAISKHLRILREYALLEEHWTGRECYYTLHAQPLLEVQSWLKGYESFWSGKLAKLKKLAELKS